MKEENFTDSDARKAAIDYLDRVILDRQDTMKTVHWKAVYYQLLGISGAVAALWMGSGWPWYGKAVCVVVFVGFLGIIYRCWGALKGRMFACPDAKFLEKEHPDPLTEAKIQGQLIADLLAIAKFNETPQQIKSNHLWIAERVFRIQAAALIGLTLLRFFDCF